MTTTANTPVANNEVAKTVTAKTVKVQVAKAKKILSCAAVVPLVNSKTKQVYLKVVKGNADKSIEATKAAVKAGKIDAFEGKARAFVKEQGIANLTVWTSRIAQVQPQRVAKSAANQIESWKRAGMTVVNAADFTIEIAAAAEENKAAEVAAA